MHPVACYAGNCPPAFFSSHIIAILAAILFPVFARARENARKATCQSNLKQIALSHSMYVQDYDQAGLPRDVGVAPTRMGWTDLLLPYVKNTGVWICPSRVTTRYTLWNGPTRTNYGYNFCFARYADATIKSPADHCIFADWRVSCIKYNAHGCGCGADCPWVRRWREGVDTPPHMDGLNLAFYDGHVKYMPRDAVNAAFGNRQKPFNNL
jgi:prepilin-type processing-associated H-X9-DG protein